MYFISVPPRIPGSRHHTELSVNVGQPLRMLCEAVGSPEPNIQWHHNGDRVEPVEARHIRLLQNGRLLQIVSAEVNSFRSFCVSKHM